ncbi:MAG: ferredoxin [Endomicrobiales bacterium]|nr:ferredoxin [Endomicrobiales bacterium]
MKAKVNAKACIGCALCVSLCPDIFQMDGVLAVAKEVELLDAVLKSAKQAVNDCPVSAIEIK